MGSFLNTGGGNDNYTDVYMGKYSVQRVRTSVTTCILITSRVTFSIMQVRNSQISKGVTPWTENDYQIDLDDSQI